MNREYVIVCPHNDDELIFSSGILEKTDTVITLVHYLEEERSLEQKMCANLFGFKQIHLGLHDDWLLAPDLETLSNMLYFVKIKFKNKKIVVAETTNRFKYYMNIHQILEKWALSFPYKIVEVKKRNDLIEIFSSIYRSQRFLLDAAPEFFKGKDRLIVF